MSFVTLVRHGQANSAARDEASYDRLSDNGRRQSEWLGAHLRQTGEVFARVYSGTLRRHVETLEAIAPDCPAPVERDARLNELEYFTLARALHEQHGIALDQNPDAFVHHFPTLLRYWQEDRLDNVPERFAAFEARVGAVLREIAGGRGRALVVTSGGLIGMAMRLVMRLDLDAMAHVCLSVENSSLHRIQPLATGLAVTQFNALPHLEAPDRQMARSHF